MILRPADAEELSSMLASARRTGTPVTGWELGALNRVTEYSPADLTVTVEAGVSLHALQEALGRHGQWLPVDPPDPAGVNIERLLVHSLDGPRRHGAGPVRNHLIGLTAVLADGRAIHSGGRVVKNVAGYDLAKLFLGSRGCLGVITSATFKVSPRPESELHLEVECESLSHAGRMVESVLRSELVPMVLDAHNLEAGKPLPGGRCRVVVGFSGTREDVEWQRTQASSLGLTRASRLDYDTAFHREADPFERLSVAPSRLFETLQRIRPDTFVSRAGDGLVSYRGGAHPANRAAPSELALRLKREFDPAGILPDLPA